MGIQRIASTLIKHGQDLLSTVIDEIRAYSGRLAERITGHDADIAKLQEVTPHVRRPITEFVSAAEGWSMYSHECDAWKQGNRVHLRGILRHAGTTAANAEPFILAKDYVSPIPFIVSCFDSQGKLAYIKTTRDTTAGNKLYVQFSDSNNKTWIMFDMVLYLNEANTLELHDASS